MRTIPGEISAPMSDALVIEPLSKQHDRSQFHCGIPELDHYIKEHVSQDVKRRLNSAFVAVSGKRVVGFYSLSATSISREDLPEKISRKLPKYPIPAVLLGRLAVDQAYQGQGLGKVLLVNAMKRAFSASQAVGMYALIVDAKDSAAKQFYEHFGFQAFESHPMRLFLPMETISGL